MHGGAGVISIGRVALGGTYGIHTRGFAWNTGKCWLGQQEVESRPGCLTVVLGVAVALPC